MKVSLVSYTPEALNLLLRTKNTRLSWDSEPASWTEEQRSEHLEYMRETIKSSWEFADYTFSIEDVSRVFTHQLVRTRHGSYAQQAQRVADLGAVEVLMPPSVADDYDAKGAWEDARSESQEVYKALVADGIPLQDARGILPQNTLTNIMAKFNLRTLSEMALVRLCTRVQGEYQEVFRAMRAEVLSVHPWAEEFLHVQCVATGTCAFPRYGKAECPVWFGGLDQTLTKATAKQRFEGVRYEAKPVAKEGKAS